MATIKRHPIPASSYEPDRPLNDLGRDQLAHFKHVAERFPEKVRAKLPAPPSPEDGMASSQFIAAVTEILMERKGKQPKLVGKRSRKVADSGLALAAGAATPKAKSKARRPKP